MAYIKIVNKDYMDWKAIYNVINYIFHYSSVPLEYVGGYGISFIEGDYADDIIEQFETVKIIYKKEMFKLLRHFVITFAPYENITPMKAKEIAWEFIKYFGKNYQVVFAVHTNTEHVHVHIVLNTTNIFTGNNYREFFEIDKINEFLNNIMINRKNTIKRLAVFN